MLTPEQEAKIASDAAAEAAAFEVANAAAASAALLAEEAKPQVLSPAQQSAKAAAVRLPGGAYPDGLVVVLNGVQVVMSRGAAINRLRQGFVTLP